MARLFGTGGPPPPPLCHAYHPQTITLCVLLPSIQNTHLHHSSLACTQPPPPRPPPAPHPAVPLSPPTVGFFPSASPPFLSSLPPFPFGQGMPAPPPPIYPPGGRGEGRARGRPPPPSCLPSSLPFSLHLMPCPLRSLLPCAGGLAGPICPPPPSRRGPPPPPTAPKAAPTHGHALPLRGRAGDR